MLAAFNIQTVLTDWVNDLLDLLGKNVQWITLGFIALAAVVGLVGWIAMAFKAEYKTFKKISKRIRAEDDLDLFDEMPKEIKNQWYAFDNSDSENACEYLTQKTCVKNTFKKSVVSKFPAAFLRFVCIDVAVLIMIHFVNSGGFWEEALFNGALLLIGGYVAYLIFLLIKRGAAKRLSREYYELIDYLNENLSFDGECDCDCEDCEDCDDCEETVEEMVEEIAEEVGEETAEEVAAPAAQIAEETAPAATAQEAVAAKAEAVKDKTEEILAKIYEYEITGASEEKLREVSILVLAAKRNPQNADEITQLKINSAMRVLLSLINKK